MNFNLETLWSHKEAEIITGGRSTAPWAATGLAMKALYVRAGDLFFASADDDLDFVFAQKAAAAVVPRSIKIPQHIENFHPILRVACPFAAMQSLAAAARFRTHSLVIAVQGFEQRRAFVDALCSASDVYEGGRHMASAIAAMPELCDFSVFGFSPALRPDVVVINQCSKTQDHGIIESMPDNGILMVNADDPTCMDVLIRARASGLRNVVTFGAANNPDASMLRQIETPGGVQTTVSIAGEIVTTLTNTRTCPHMPTLVQNMNMLLAAMLLVKMADKPLRHMAQEMAEGYMSPFAMSNDESTQQQNVTLFAARSKPAAKKEEAVFRVKNLVDVGNGRKTLILDQGTQTATQRDWSMPSRLGQLDVVCASKKVSVFKSARKALQSALNNGPLSPIVPEVLTPGDYVVFKSTPQSATATFTEALRLQTPLRNSNAV